MRRLVCIFLAFLAGIYGLPTGFRDEGVVIVDDEGYGGATGFNFVPTEDGSWHLLMAEKSGRIFAVLDPDAGAESEVIVALDIRDRVCDDGEQGIQQVLAHPKFLENRHVYVYFTVNGGFCSGGSLTGAFNRVSRFFLGRDNRIHLDSEKILLESPWMPTIWHNGGDMLFGNDGHLYVTFGDGGNPTSVNHAQRPNTLLGTIVRITDDGEVPSDNPFVGQANSAPCRVLGEIEPGKVCEETFAWGLRNPFRFALNPYQPNTTQFYVMDVGQNTWEEIDEVSLEFAGANYGYRPMEGPCTTHYRDDEFECRPRDEFKDPLFWYEHTDEYRGDASITGGAFVPPGLWGDDLGGTFLFADWIYEKIFVLTESNNGCRTCLPPTPDFEMSLFSELGSIGQPIQLTFGPYKDTQALYYSIWEPKTYYSIRRIIYETDETPGQGSSVETGIIATEVPVNETEEIIEVNPLAPTPFILYPPPGAQFAVGDVLTVYGYALDVDGLTLPDSSLVWEVRQHHNTHWHPFLHPTTGNGITMPPAPPPEDFLASTNSFLKVRLTATVSIGLSSTVTLDIMPKTKKLYFGTDPPGLSLNLDGYKVDTPKEGLLEVTTWVNHSLTVLVPEQQSGMMFDSWNCANCPMTNMTRRNVLMQVDDAMSVNDTFVAVFKETP